MLKARIQLMHVAITVQNSPAPNKELIKWKICETVNQSVRGLLVRHWCSKLGTGFDFQWRTFANLEKAKKAIGNLGGATYHHSLISFLTVVYLFPESPKVKFPVEWRGLWFGQLCHTFTLLTFYKIWPLFVLNDIQNV